MTKIGNNAQTFKAQLMKIAHLKCNEENILNFLSIYKGLEFNKVSLKTYQCNTDNSIKVWFGSKTGVWFFEDKNGSIEPTPLDELIKQELEQYPDEFKNAERAKILSKIANYSPSNYTSLQDRKIKKQKVAKKSGKLKDISNNPVFAEWDENTNFIKATLEYFREKTGAEKYDLKKFNIKPVAHIRDGEKVKKYGSDYFAFGCITENSVLVKTPKNRFVKNNQYRYFRHKKFCFGLDQLKKKNKQLVKHIFILEGIEDAMTAQMHSEKGVYTISFGGVNVCNNTIRELKNTFPKAKIYTLFDNDKTGLNAGVKAALENNIIHIDFKRVLGEYSTFAKYTIDTDIKDICELYMQSCLLHGYSESSVIIEELIKFCAQFGKIENIETRKDQKVFKSYLGQFYDLRINQYISESINSRFDILKNLLRIHEKCVLSSPAGTGKTRMLITLCGEFYGEKLGFIKNNLGCKSVVIGTPTTSIATQLYYDFLKEGFDREDVTLVSGGQVTGDITEGKIIISVFDSLTKDEIVQLLDNSLLVIDEFHQLTNDSHYRKSSMAHTVNLLRIAKRKLLLSATPNLLFCTDAHDLFGYTLIKCTPSIKNRIDGFIYKHNEKLTDLAGHIVNSSANVNGHILIKIDNLGKLETIKEYLDSIGESSVIVSSKEKKYKENNEHYKQLMRTGSISNDIKFILTTTVLEAGVSIKSKLSEIHILDTKNIDRIIQLATRGRLQTDGTNSKIKLCVYLTDKKEKDSEQEKKKYSQFTGLDSVEIFKILLSDAQNRADHINTRVSNKNALGAKSDTDESNTLVFKINGTYIPNIAGITNEIYKIKNSCTDAETIKKFIEHLDDRFYFRIDLLKNVLAGELDEISKSIGAEQENSEKEFKKLLEKESKKMLSAMCYLSKDLETKQNVRKLYQLPVKDTEENKQFIIKNKESFAYRHTSTILKLISEIVKTGEHTRLETIEIAHSEKLADIKKIKNKSVINWREKKYKNEDTKQQLEKIDQLEAIRTLSIKKTFSTLLKNIKAGRTKNELKPETITTKVNQAIEKGFNSEGMSKKSKLTFQKAKAILDLFFKLERKQKRTGKKVVSFYSFAL